MRAFVEQVDSNIATLLLGEDEQVRIYLPVSWLPPGAREGSVLQCNLQLDAAATNAAKAEVLALYDALKAE